MKAFSASEVAQHNKRGDLWVIIDSEVYDLSKFSDLHPGGPTVLLDADIGELGLGMYDYVRANYGQYVAGQDATEAFFSLHLSEILSLPQYTRLKVGVVQGHEDRLEQDSIPLNAISKIPYAEPSWLTNLPSPYYKPHHFEFLQAYRSFIRGVVLPDARAREEDGKPPSQHVLKEMARLNIPAMRLGRGEHLKGRKLMDGVITEDQVDHFIKLIMIQESSHLHSRGYSDGLGGGAVIALPPIIAYASAKLKDLIVPQVLDGKKSVCLAITEAFAGSDIQGPGPNRKGSGGIRTTAKKVAGGYRVTGTKKWITNAMWADWFVTACRVEDAREGDGDIIALIISRGEGITTRPLKTSYSSGAAGTAFIVFDDVFVPEGNLLRFRDPSGNGKETPVRRGDGLRILLGNFNHERWVLAAETVSIQRAITSQCFKWVSLRHTFGRPLSSQPVVRGKLANMAARVETGQGWLEQIAYWMDCINNGESNSNSKVKAKAEDLASPISLLKMHVTRDAQATAADAAQIFGGRSFTRTGMGRDVEHFHRTLLIDAIGGGAEDILADLGIRQALRRMPKGREARL
ncbi:hypothetical protein D9758_012578 [Tetrapyrgos nigripes]|uniref:Cytochrome b5 heme-binding domain-containing protein n=1 Tax=Tetrapyrgos nigripes TaxID=182062 RepID=A0A8H5FLV5_9AGAR|nr:hypothetical protein D9758_012578 [Tetrapyrgos nigripes]